MLANLKKLLGPARQKHFAVGAFNVNNMEILQAVMCAAEAKKSPVILQTSEGALRYGGKYLFPMLKQAANDSKIPVAIHLDHGQKLETVKKCVKLGYSSVMIDASHLRFEENIKLTRKAVSIAHKKGVSVEAELGTIGGAEDLVSARKILLTDPHAAVEFVARTGIDALAVAIGTSHGAYKFSGKAKLDIGRLAHIASHIKLPLVLHGASEVSFIKKTAQKYGAKISEAEGVPDSQIRQAIQNGICKINTDTDLRLAFTAGVRGILKKNPSEFDPRHILVRAMQLMQKVVEHRISVFGSAGKAKLY